MKKTLLFMCMMGLCVLSYAQIALEETFANEFIVLGELSGGKALNVIGYTASAMGGGHYHAGAEHKLFCRFYHDRLAFGIYVITANRFDDHLEIVLGEDFETAQQAFSDLLYWYDNSHKGQSVSFTDVWGRKVQIDRRQDHILVRIIDDVEFKVIADNVILNVVIW
ncbi:MAG: hypothetical protein K2J62_00390 [Bacteroidales bacterium]|nr:hypothetical protein [Bacteroidales bacterium]